MNDPKKKKKPSSYQAMIIENHSDGTYIVRLETGRREKGQYVPEVRKRSERCDAGGAAIRAGEATAILQEALLASKSGA